MATESRSRPERYSADGLPIYYSVYNEKNGKKLHMSFRLPKSGKKVSEPEYGKILYEETHKLPAGAEAQEAVIDEMLEACAPEFWRKFLLGSAEGEKYLSKVLNKEDGLPLAVAWAIGSAELAQQLGWKPITCQRKEKIFSLMVQQGWGAVPIGELNAKFCGDAFLTGFSYSDHKACLALLRQLVTNEIGHKRLAIDPWKGSRMNRKAPPKQSKSYVNQHIRQDHIEKEMVWRIVDEMINLLSEPQEQKYALALLFCLTMGLPVEEVAYLTCKAISFNGNGLPIALHVSGTVTKKAKRFVDTEYPKSSPKNRVLPIATRLAVAMKPILEAWKEKSADIHEFGNRYIVPNAKHLQRKTSPVEIRNWINERLRKQLADERMHDGTGSVIGMRSPYQRCLATPRLSLLHGGFEEDEHRYFFGKTANSTAGEYYCDFVNVGEQARMRSILDRWLGGCNQAAVDGEMNSNNPAANHELAFGAQGQIAHLVLELVFPPVPEELLTVDGYSLHFFAQCGFSLGAVVTS